MRLILWRLPLTLLRFSLYGLVFFTPIFGFWLCSSLVAYTNGPTMLAVFSGILLFPLIPIIWDWIENRKNKKKGILSWGDRFILKSLLLNFLFIACLLAVRPQTSFLALSVRGDWMLDGKQGVMVEYARQNLFKLANGLEWLYLTVHQNPYRQYADKTNIQPTTETLPTNSVKEKNTQNSPKKEQEIDQTNTQPTTETLPPDSVSNNNTNNSPKEEQKIDKTNTQPTTETLPTHSVKEKNTQNSSEKAREIDKTNTQPTTETLPTHSVKEKNTHNWPWEEQGIHPVVVNMPKEVETSIKSVAEYIAKKETDPVLRIKALHDYVADRIAYDGPAYLAKKYPPQDAQAVFTRRTAVCAGYSKLLEALGQAIGEEIVYITGDVRIQTSDLNGEGHAWNGVKIQGVWYLIDATWDSGYLEGSKFVKRYRNIYFLPPPRVMAITHFPDDPSWQLLQQPLSLGEFLRQPMLHPQFYAQELNLIAPMRSQSDVQETAIIELENPQKRWFLADYQALEGGEKKNCTDPPTQNHQIICSFPNSGIYQVNLFSGSEQYGQYSYVGKFEFNSR